jgi:hypothetical protein
MQPAPARETAQWARSAKNAARVLLGATLLALLVLFHHTPYGPYSAMDEVLQNVNMQKRRLASQKIIVPDKGTQTLLAGKTVRAAVIASDTKSLLATHPALHQHTDPEEVGEAGAAAVLALKYLLEVCVYVCVYVYVYVYVCVCVYVCVYVYHLPKGAVLI